MKIYRIFACKISRRAKIKAKNTTLRRKNTNRVLLFYSVGAIKNCPKTTQYFKFFYVAHTDFRQKKFICQNIFCLKPNQKKLKILQKFYNSMRFCTAFKTLFSYAFFGRFGRIMPSDRRLKMPFFCLWAVENPVFFSAK